MLKLFKHLKPFAFHIFLIFIFLFIQATSELSLPDYMSGIVNVGIQQRGVENSVFSAIRDSEYKKLKLFMSEEEQRLFERNYVLMGKDSPLGPKKEFPISYQENIYVFSGNGAEDKKALNSLLGTRIAILKGVETGDFSNLPGFMGYELDESMIKLMPKGMSFLEAIERIPEDKKEEFLKTLDKVFEVIPPSLITQSSIPYIIAEYEAIGIDTQKMQNNYILKIGGYMLLVALVSMMAIIVVSFISSRVAAGLGMSMREQVFVKVTGFSGAEMDEFSTASLITRSTNDVQQVQMLMVMMFRMVFYAPLIGIGGIIKALSTNTSMAWIIAVGVVGIIALVSILFSIAHPRFKRIQRLIDRVNLIIRESLVGIMVIRAFNTERFQERKFEKANRELMENNIFTNRLMSVMWPFMHLIMNGLMLLILWIGAHEVDMGAIQVGDMMAFMQYTMRIIMSFFMISMVSISLPRASVSAQRIVEVVEKIPSIRDPEKAVEFSGENRGLVEFKDVCFKYPRAEECVIADISFVAKPGETTAIIGSTGSGKSTIINLIPRFYDVFSGEILVDGINIKDVSQKDLRRKIGYIPQRGILFSGTVGSNISYGSDEISEEDVEKAAEIAQAKNFIESYDEQYDYGIAQGGSNVSGGQRQRLSIARALAKNPDIFIFDDSFSALDYKTDAALRKAIREELDNKTVIIVAQRISTIINAEKIIVVDEGKIVGQGNHKYLLDNCEVYREIALSQFSDEELR